MCFTEYVVPQRTRQRRKGGLGPLVVWQLVYCNMLILLRYSDYIIHFILCLSPIESNVTDGPTLSFYKFRRCHGRLFHSTAMCLYTSTDLSLPASSVWRLEHEVEDVLWRVWSL